MANEVQVFEMSDAPGARLLRQAPFIEKQVLTIGGAASAAFNASTTAITVISSTACKLDFGTAPDGNGDTFPIAADTPYDFAVRRALKVIAVA
jgi:hypothetical protein